MAKNIQERLPNTSMTLRTSLIADYQKVRKFTEQLCETLEIEDYVIQSMPDVSPTKWHLAHTTWFFETFLLNSLVPNANSLDMLGVVPVELSPSGGGTGHQLFPFPRSVLGYCNNYTSPHPQYAYLFNSYYNSLGERHSRPKRGLISRPTVKEVYAYRVYVDEYTLNLLATCNDKQLAELAPILTLGLHHEQQHQELMVTDIKHVLSCNPLHPVYRPRKTHTSPEEIPAITWVTFPENIAWIGHEGDSFSYDHEEPRHRELVHAFQLASRLVTNGEYLQFIEAGGYSDPLLWLSQGWYIVQQEGWEAPLYWEKHDGRWFYMTLGGFREVDMAEPVCHVSYYEADAYARWAEARLQTEAEWEVAAQNAPIEGNFVEHGFYHPVPLTVETLTQTHGISQLYGDVWEWTQSHYSPYPGFKPAPGAVGEYNGKFMCNQFVLRGGSCATSQTHMRATYRNFFPADARWQFMGIRLAREV